MTKEQIAKLYIDTLQQILINTMINEKLTKSQAKLIDKQFMQAMALASSRRLPLNLIIREKTDVKNSR